VITVYTALFGDPMRDRLQPPPAGCDAQYVCFTDAPLAVPGWTIERVSSAGRSPAFLARLFKARPDRWFGETTTIWADASCQLLQPASALVSAADRAVDTVGWPAPVVGLRHPDRSCIEDEAAEVIRIDLAPADVVRAQLAAYQRAGFETARGPVTTTGLLIRRPEAHVFNDLWETQLIRYNLRDQLSVDYCGWATGTSIGHLAGHYRDNAFMRYTRHARLAS